MPHTSDNGPEKRVLITAIAIFICALLFACNTHTHKEVKKPLAGGDDVDESFSQELSQILKPIDTAAGKKQLKTIADNVRYTYQLNGYGSLWLEAHGKPSKNAETFINELADLHWDGLDTSRYNIAGVRKLYSSLNANSNVNDRITFDTTLTHSYLTAAHDLLLGEISPKAADSLWYHKNDTVWNAPELLAGMDKKYSPLGDFRSKVPTYGILREEYKRYASLAADNGLADSIRNFENAPDKEGAATAIINKEMPWLQNETSDSMSGFKLLLTSYQSYGGVKVTGKLDSGTIAHLSLPISDIMQKLQINMERIRWMQQDMGNLYVLVDVPMMELFLRKDGGNAMHMRVVVGKPVRQTPSLDANMANVVINPPWGVPPTILKKDVLPGITKSGNKYLARKGLKAYDRKGNVVNASSINAGNYKRYSYKQSPGDDNALGYVKFNLPNPWDIYLHDTPHRGDFVKSYRALSSGCIRLQQPQQMALYILSELEKKRYDQDRLDSIISTHKTRWEILKDKIPVHIVYLTAFEDTTGKHVKLISDVYKRDEKLKSLLK